MKVYRNVKAILIDDESLEPKHAYPINDFLEVCRDRKVLYLLQVGSDYIPVPVSRHRVVLVNNKAFCLSGTKNLFDFKEESHAISNQLGGENKKILYAGIDNEIHVEANFFGIKIVNEIVPVFCALVKDSEVLLWYFNAVKPQERSGTVHVCFTINSTQLEGIYEIHFYIAGTLVFEEQLEYRQTMYAIGNRNKKCTL